MTDQESIKAITEIANYELREKYPLLDRHFEGWEIPIILSAYCKWYLLNRAAEEVKGTIE